MKNVINFPSREKLGFSAECSDEVVARSGQSYHQGYNAFLRGLQRRRPSWKSEVFDHESWLKGWDDAERSSPKAA